jgi:cation transport ATPase
MATPTAIMVGTGRGAGRHLDEERRSLETVHRVQTMIFDKTEPDPREPVVTEVVAVDGVGKAAVGLRPGRMGSGTRSARRSSPKPEDA